MSELKAICAFDAYEEYLHTVDDDSTQVYRKSEADRYINWLKYKRCKAMAQKYLLKRTYWRDSAPGYERQFAWENMAYRHYKRWLELADKFKEAK